MLLSPFPDLKLHTWLLLHGAISKQLWRSMERSIKHHKWQSNNSLRVEGNKGKGANQEEEKQHSFDTFCHSFSPFFVGWSHHHLHIFVLPESSFIQQWSSINQLSLFLNPWHYIHTYCQ
jgi:hypothetical protein